MKMKSLNPITAVARIACYSFSVALALMFAPQSFAQGNTTPTGDAVATAYRQEMTESMQKMHHVMSPDLMTGDPDIDFLRMMLPHHQGAVDMARVELKYGKSEKLKELARKIVSTQEEEILQMKKWLAELDATSTGTTNMTGHTMTGHMNSATTQSQPMHH
jgi:hypothetical protein